MRAGYQPGEIGLRVRAVAGELGDDALAHRLGLVLAELSKELKVDVSHDELSAQIDTLKQYYGKDAKTAKQFDNPDVHRDIANRLITDKTIQKLVELNTK